MRAIKCNTRLPKRIHTRYALEKHGCVDFLMPDSKNLYKINLKMEDPI